MHWPTRVLLTLLLAVGLVGVHPAQAAPAANFGGRVMSFGTNGAMRYDPKRGPDTANAPAVDTLGRILVVGSVRVPAAYSFGALASTDALVRFLPDGGVDTSFGTNGRRPLYSPSGNPFTVHAYVVTVDNRIVVVGNAGTEDWLVRLRSSGALDTSFGPRGDGWRRLPSKLSNMALLQRLDGRLVLGASGQPTMDDPYHSPSPYLLGFTANGDPDTTFGVGGVVGPVGAGRLCCTTVVRGLALRPDGGLLLGVEQYYSDTDAALFAFSAAGIPDLAFADDGMLALGYINSATTFLSSFAVHPSGRITAQLASTLEQWLPDGSVDTSFGTNGHVNVSGAFLLADGEKTVEMYNCCGFQRRLADGSPDPTFGDGWEAVLDQRFPTSTVGGIAFRPGLAGEHPVVVVAAGADMVVFALNPTGAPDLTFAGTGVRALDVGHAGSTLTARTAIADGHGGVFVGGYADGLGAVAHILSTGKYDKNFGVAGVAVIHELPSVEQLVRGAFGSVTAVGLIGAKRLTSAGQPDPTFNGGRTLLVNGLQEYGFPNTVAALPLTGGRILVTGWSAAAVITFDGAIDPELGVYNTHLPGVQALVRRGAGYLMLGYDNDFGRTPHRITMRAESAPGVVDPSFGNEGTALVDEPPGEYWGPGTFTAMATARGVLVHVGEQTLRVLPTGERDATFTIEPPAGAGVTAQPDGHIIAMSGNAARRYDANGVLDDNFGNHGVIGVGVGLDSYFETRAMVMSGTRLYFIGTVTNFGSGDLVGRLGVIARDSTLTGGAPELRVTPTTEVTEGQKGLAVTLQFDRAPDVPIIYEYVLESGTANVPGDAGPNYAVQDQVTYGPPVTTARARFSVVDDAVHEGDERFTLRITRDDFALVRADRGTVVIHDND